MRSIVVCVMMNTGGPFRAGVSLGRCWAVGQVRAVSCHTWRAVVKTRTMSLCFHLIYTSVSFFLPAEVVFSYENTVSFNTEINNNTVNMEEIRISFILFACATTISQLRKLCVVERAHDYE